MSSMHVCHRLLALTSALFAVWASAAAFHVAPSGRDANPGTADAPFRTVVRAQAAVREERALAPQQDLEVVLHQGVYELESPLVFDGRDSSVGPSKVVYRASAGERVVFSGGRRITGWQAGPDGVWSAPVPGVRGTKPYETGGSENWAFRQLFVNGIRAWRARDPNRDDAPPERQLAGARVTEDAADHIYEFGADTLHEWQAIDEVECVVKGNWAITRKFFGSVDPATGQAHMQPPHAEPHRAIAPRKGRWHVIENAREALDQPGEWYLDREAETLFYLPRPGENMRTADVVAPRLERLIEVVGSNEAAVCNLHFRGIHFAYASWVPPKGGYLGVQACHSIPFTKDGRSWRRNPVGSALHFDFAESCSVTGGSIAHLGGCGIHFEERPTGNVIEGVHIFDVSGNGVLLGGPFEELAMPRGNRIANNVIADCGLEFYGATGIWVGFAQETVIAHNLIHDLPYSGISIGWQWNEKPTPCRDNVIEWNHIHDVMNVLCDGGGIYTLGRQPGSVLRGNHIHDISRSGHAQGAPNNGVFADQGSMGFVYERNLIYAAAGLPVRFNQCKREWHEWRDNVFGMAPTQVPSVSGQFLACDGSSTVVDVPHSPELEPAELTVEARVYLPTLSQGGRDARRWIVGKNANEWAKGHYGLVIRGNVLGAYMNFEGRPETEEDAWGDARPLEANRWHHVAMTYDGRELAVFLNGEQIGSARFDRPRVPGSGPLTIARRPDGYVTFRGGIDQVRIFSRALTAAELAGHASDASALATRGEASGLIRQWDFEEPAYRIVTNTHVEDVVAKAGLEPGYESVLSAGE